RDCACHQGVSNYLFFSSALIKVLEGNSEMEILVNGKPNELKAHFNKFSFE
nr:hypothetical protein [Tanacetum cinerariifolium]